MIVSLLHLSDIHLIKERNVIVQRKEKVFEAIKNELKGKDYVFIITSGDIAFSGLSEEYNVALDFYKYLYKSIKEYTNLQAPLLFVPGNHDCFFDAQKDEIRKIILENLGQKGLTDLSDNMISICCSPQENYETFLKELNSKLHYNGDLVFDHPLLKIVTFKIGDKIFKFNLYNTSWDSSKNEKIGALKFPIDYIYDKIPSIDNYISISIVHHPFNWQSLETSRDFRESLSRSSEIIMSGHEHQATQSLSIDIEEMYKTIHIESSALQEGNNDRDSEFNIINIDTDLSKFEIKIYKYEVTSAEYKLNEVRPWKSIDKERKLKSKQFELKKNYFDELESPGASFTHSQVEEVKLSDIYTPPFLNNISIDKVKKTNIVNFEHSETALNLPEDDDIKFYKLVLGNESSGKTAMLKYYYIKYYNKGYFPVYFSANEVDEANKDKLKNIIGKQFKKQYNELEAKFENIDYKKVIILIDDLYKLRNKKLKVSLVRNLKSLFEKIIITGNELMLFETYSDHKDKKVELFDTFDQYLIQEFNPSLRASLVTKWYRLGKDYLNEAEKIEFYRQLDYAQQNINTIIGKNLIPSYPIYILSILQALESGQTDSTTNNLHAYYYEMLITRSLRKVLKDQDEIGFYMTLSKEYFYFLFSEKIRFRPIAKDGFLLFLNDHVRKYSLSNLNADSIIDVLVKSRILKINQDSEIAISFKYLYYYFVAKYLSDNLDNEDTRKVVDKMTDRVFVEEYSNILLFLTHLIKSNFVIGKLVEKSRKIFSDCEPIKLEGDIDFINTLQKSVPLQVLENYDVDQSREDNLKEEDQYEYQEKASDIEKAEEDYDLDDDINSLDYIALLTKALRTISILGQLTKKYWGELIGPDKFNLTEETYLLGLRTLKFHFGLIEKGKDDLSDHIIRIIQKRFVKDNLSKSQVEDISANFIFTISSTSAYGVFKRIVNAIGTEKLASTFTELQEKYPINSVKIINTGIKLDHYSSFPMGDIEKLKPEFVKNPLAMATLQTFVLDYLYMYPLPYDKKQQICELLGIKIQDQRFIENTSPIKKI